jgi:hypothetical protein
VASNGIAFTVVAAPMIWSISPAAGSAGTTVTISGSGFGSTQGAGQAWLGTAQGTVTSWSDTQIVATIGTNARSGNAQVRQAGLFSNSIPLSVSTAAISGVSPNNGVPGTTVTISGSGFGAAQGTGQVWLGTANATVQSWSDGQIVAIVAPGAATGNAQVLQNGVMSNAIPFTINTLKLISISPTSGASGTSVTLSGVGFGATQGSGVVWLGSTAGRELERRPDCRQRCPRLTDRDRASRAERGLEQRAGICGARGQWERDRAVA